MKYLALGLLLSSLASLSNAVCYRKQMKMGITHCRDHVDNTMHEVGSTWRNSQCMQCTCSECCPAWTTPANVPEECVTIFDSKTCKYTVHRKDDPSQSCPTYSAGMY